MIVNKKYHRSKQGRNSEMAKMEYPIQAFNTKLDIRQRRQLGHACLLKARRDLDTQVL